MCPKNCAVGAPLASAIVSHIPFLASMIVHETTNVFDATQWFCRHAGELYEGYYGWHCADCDVFLFSYGNPPWAFLTDEFHDDDPCDGTVSETEYFDGLPEEAFFERGIPDFL